MGFLRVILLVVLIIPIFAIFTDSPLGRALARRVAGRNEPPPELDNLAQRVEALSSEVDDLSRAVDTLREENQFLQRLIEDGGGRPPLPPRSSP
ncbi:MAG: hypothetical protein HOP28_10490 [Gemmatimonadales bacterium]|nr:hypothetical protein [Gemmatimonadales bacterium]